MGRIAFRLKVLTVVLLSIMTAGVLGFMGLERLSLGDAVYFTVVTLATVGYGDIVPVTPAGRALALVIIISGVGTFLGVIANLTEFFIQKQEREHRKQKLHIIIGVFYSEGGRRLLEGFASIDPGVASIRDRFAVSDAWTPRDYARARSAVSAYDFGLDGSRIELPPLRDFLKEKSELLLRLIENPYILEHESFTELLRAVLHLKEELLLRDDLTAMSRADIEHLAGDMRRAYRLMAVEWLDYMLYIQENYPYLFSLARRMNPFMETPSATVT